MNTDVPIIDQLQEALRAEHRDELLINFLQGERKAEIFAARQQGNLIIIFFFPTIFHSFYLSFILYSFLFILSYSVIHNICVITLSGSTLLQ